MNVLLDRLDENSSVISITGGTESGGVGPERLKFALPCDLCQGCGVGGRWRAERVKGILDPLVSPPLAFELLTWYTVKKN